MIAHSLWLLAMCCLSLVVVAGVRDLTVIYLGIRRERLRAERLLDLAEAEGRRVDVERAEIEHVRSEAVRLNRETIERARLPRRWTRDDHVEFAQSLGYGPNLKN